MKTKHPVISKKVASERYIICNLLLGKIEFIKLTIRDLERVSRLIWHSRHWCESCPPFTNYEYKGMKFHLNNHSSTDDNFPVRRSNYHSPHSFERMINSLSDKETKESFSIFHNNVRSLWEVTLINLKNSYLVT